MVESPTSAQGTGTVHIGYMHNAHGTQGTQAQCTQGTQAQCTQGTGQATGHRHNAHGTQGTGTMVHQHEGLHPGSGVHRE